MASLITPQFERYIAEQTIAQGYVVFDEFIFANIPGLNENNLAQHLTMPTSAQIVHRQAISQNGVINENAVVYSVTIGTEVGDFDFNFIGLINKSKNLLAVAVQTAPVRKTRNKNSVQGNSITRNILLEFSGAKSLTGINVSAETWQIDFTVRLHGIDEKIRLTNRDLYGRAVFFDDGFLVQRKTGNQFIIKPGLAYVEGVRMNLTALHTLTANNLPCSIYADVVHHCTVTGAYETEIKYLTQSKDDYVDTANRQHYVQILADIDRNGNVTDRRLLSLFLGITPKDLDDTTVNKADKTGHTHKLPIASLVKRGIAKLYSGYDSDSEEMAATPKAIKGLKALIDAVTRNLGNYIPNSKKSNAVNSPSSDTIATSAAAKTAYDKGVEAKNAADNAQRTANTKQSPATTLAGYGITDFVVKGEPSTTNARDLNADGIYAFGSGGKNLPTNGAFKVVNLGGGSTAWRHQLAMKAYSTEVYLSSQESANSSNWLPWVRIDGQDRVLKSGDTMTGNLTINHGEPRVHGNRNNSNNWYVGLPNGSSNDLNLHSYAHNTSLILLSDRVRATKPLYVGSDSVALTKDFTYQKIGDIEVRKYPDGTMVQTCRKRMLTGDYSKVNFNWAIAFTEMPILTATAQYLNSVGDHDTIITFVQGTSNTACHLVCGETYNNNGEIAYVNIVAIGRWK
ncbi:phage tail protein [Rodentibacter pneumotropicus]|uniref:phage tail-collar fiber domain-containing protein n=1 Tax=Rodentibacter pneumotropicus TaxID=758 RepID=UPI0018640A67|nr:phage tail protein [Rodentibacter pneumotropicus]